MDLNALGAALDAFAVRHHLVPLVAFALIARAYARPLLVELRDFAIFFYALGYAWAGLHSIDLDKVRKERESEIPEVPAVSSSLLDSAAEIAARKVTGK